MIYVCFNTIIYFRCEVKKQNLQPSSWVDDYLLPFFLVRLRNCFSNLTIQTQIIVFLHKLSTNKIFRCFALKITFLGISLNIFWDYYKWRKKNKKSSDDHRAHKERAQFYFSKRKKKCFRNKWSGRIRRPTNQIGVA